MYQVQVISNLVRMDVMTLKCSGAFGCLQYFGPANLIVIVNLMCFLDHLVLKCYGVEILCSWMLLNYLDHLVFELF